MSTGARSSASEIPRQQTRGFQLYVACEGRLVAFVAAADAERALSALRAHPLGPGAARIGVVEPGPAGEVVAITPFGGERLLDLPLGEQLPRIS